MLNPADLVDAIVAALQDIPEFVTEMNSEPDRISAYHDQFPARVNLGQAIYQMDPPSTLVAWRETAPGSVGRMEMWKHSFSVYFRPKEHAAGDDYGYGKLMGLLINGVPTSGTGQKLLNEPIHASCFPMDVPTFARNTLMVTQDSSIDYFEVRLTLTEMGDQ